MKPSFLLINICLIAFSFGSALAAQLTSIPLKYRTAEQVIPLIKPMVDDSVRLSGQAFQLFIKGDSEQIAFIKEMINELDVAPKSFQVYVRVSSQSSQKKKDAQIKVDLSNQGSQVSTKYHSTSQKDNDGLQQSIRTTEGYPAYLNTGEFIPTAFRVYGASGTQYTPVISGFYLLPQSRGDDQVMFTISQQKQQLKNRNIQQQSLSTQLLLPINQWTVIGESNQVENQSNNNVLSTRATQQSSTLVEMKVVLIQE